MYYPYGEVRWGEGTLATDFGFTGQRSVAGTGLVFMHARFYDPLLGRFVSADTIVPDPGNPQSFNRYSYVLNNPLKYIDPSGHWENEVDLARNLGFEGESDEEILDAWHKSDLYRKWSQNEDWIPMLLSKEFDFGSILRSGGQMKYMLTKSKAGTLLMWELTRRELCGGKEILDRIFDGGEWSLWQMDFSDPIAGVDNYKLTRHVRGSGGSLFQRPVLGDNWWKGPRYDVGLDMKMHNWLALKDIFSMQLSGGGFILLPASRLFSGPTTAINGGNFFVKLWNGEYVKSLTPYVTELSGSERLERRKELYEEWGHYPP